MSSKPRSNVTRLDVYRRRRTVAPMDRSFDDVIGRAPIGFMHLDGALRCAHINAWLAAAYGIAVDDALGRPFRQLVPGRTAEIEHDLERLLDGGSALRLILKIERAGEKAYYQHHFAPAVGDGGRVRGIDVFVCNVDGPMRAHRHLRMLDACAREGAKRIPSRRTGAGGSSATGTSPR
ncbi:MAG TPA: PAS domain-containing protein [Gammaproteobacteria bacterium]